MNILETFYMQYQRQALDIRWWAHMSNAEVRQRSTIYQPLMASCVIVVYLFNYVARLEPGVRASDALHLMTNSRQKANGMQLDPPRKVWLNYDHEDADAIPLSTLRSEIARHHGAAKRSDQTTRRR